MGRRQAQVYAGLAITASDTFEPRSCAGEATFRAPPSIDRIDWRAVVRRDPELVEAVMDCDEEIERAEKYTRPHRPHRDDEH